MGMDRVEATLFRLAGFAITLGVGFVILYFICLLILEPMAFLIFAVIILASWIIGSIVLGIGKRLIK